MPGTGDSASSTDFKEFFDELLTIIPPERIGLFRADIGFCNETIMKTLENKRRKYILATRMMVPLVRQIFEQKKWFPIDDGYWTASFVYQGKGWSKPRRMEVVRKDNGKHPATGGKLLFPEIQEPERSGAR